MKYCESKKDEWMTKSGSEYGEDQECTGTTRRVSKFQDT